MSGGTRQVTADSPEPPQPQFTTDSVDELETLLERAANWAERDCHAYAIAEELRDGLEFVREEVDDAE